MNTAKGSSALWAGLYLTAMCLLGMYFTFASVQGDFGLFRRVQIEAEAASLTAERARLEAEVVALRNKTRRLSDGYLDLELLDQQARDVLGMVRADEVVLIRP
jgi:cell division protein FtsB